jgi:hypothetical protein
MKTMTCKQLHGPCDEPIHGETAEEMMQNSQKHGMDMAAKGDQDHIKVMEEMKGHVSDPEAVKQFMDKFHSDFDATPEDN